MEHFFFFEFSTWYFIDVNTFLINVLHIEL